MIQLYSAIKYSKKGLKIELPDMIEKVPGPNDDKTRDGLRKDFRKKMVEQLSMSSFPYRRVRYSRNYFRDNRKGSQMDRLPLHLPLERVVGFRLFSSSSHC